MEFTYSPWQLFMFTINFATRFGYEDKAVKSAQFSNRKVSLELENGYAFNLTHVGVAGGGYAWQMMVDKGNVRIIHLLEREEGVAELFKVLEAMNVE